VLLPKQEEKQSCQKTRATEQYHMFHRLDNVEKKTKALYLVSKKHELQGSGSKKKAFKIQ
jgi:hypothetical protein